MPLAISTSISASVPLAQPTAWRAPQNSASRASNSATSGPWMNWQCSVTRAMASSMARPSLRRWAPTSMNGIGAIGGADALVHQRVEFVGGKPGGVSRRPGAVPLRGAHRRHGRPAFQAADRDLEAGDALLAGHRRRLAGADRIDEGDKLGAQRLVVADREVPHRIGAVRLEAEALGDLARQQIADHVLAAGRDRDVARLERRQPVGVDVGEHARSGAELQQRDVLALGDRAGELRLHLDDVGIGEPADQVDVVHREVDHHADIRHARRERADAGDARWTECPRRGSPA